MSSYVKDIDIQRLKELSDDELEICLDESSGSGDEVIEEGDHVSNSELSDDSEGEIPINCHIGNNFADKNKCYVWNATPLSNTSKVKSENIEKVLPGPKLCAKDAVNEIDAFLKFIDLGIIDKIVLHTNMCIAKKKLEVQYSRERDCQETDRTEILAVIGMLYLFGTKKGQYVNVQELWQTDGSGMQIVRAAFSYKRFLFLLRSIRFDDKETRHAREENDKLAAIREIMEEFTENCKQNYSLSEFVTVGEMLHPFKGKCGFVQYIPNKPARYGLKIYALCCAKTLYTGNLEVYCGKQNDGSPYLVTNSPDDVVVRLVSHIQHTYRNVTTGNYYTSYSLSKRLLDIGLTTVGTVKKYKKEIPPEFLPNKTRAVESSTFGFHDNFTLVSYVPKKRKAVVLLSTMHDKPDIDCGTRKPCIIMDYNATKSAVDTVDQMCSWYSVSRITRRWSMSLFFRLLDIAGVNAHVLLKGNKQDCVRSRRKFLHNLAFSLFETHMVRRAKISSLPLDIRTFLSRYNEEQTNETKVQQESNRKRGKCVKCGRVKNTTTLRCQICGQFTCKRHAKCIYHCITCSNTV